MKILTKSIYNNLSFYTNTFKYLNLPRLKLQMYMVVSNQPQPTV